LHWDGKRWSNNQVPGATNDLSELKGITALSDNEAWAVGAYRRESADGLTMLPLMMHWNGAQWSVIHAQGMEDSPLDYDPADYDLYDVAAISPNDVWAVGEYWKLGETEVHQALALHWDGAEWNQVPTPMFSVEQGGPVALIGITAISSNDVWAVGGGMAGFGGPLVLHWNGSNWQAVHGLDPTLGPLSDVAASGPDDVWAVGERNLHAHWDGHAWSWIYGLAPADTSLGSVVAVSSNDVWAFGGSAEYRSIVEHWDGKAWRLVASPATRALEVATIRDHSIWVKSERTLMRHLIASCVEPTPAPPAPVPGDKSETYPATGKTVKGAFLDYVGLHGIAQLGNPLSEVVSEVSELDGEPYNVQYLDMAVLEYHASQSSPYNVQLSQLGTFQYKKRYPQGAPGEQASNAPNEMGFPDLTRKHLGGPFLDYWLTHGYVDRFGYPVSEEFQETSDLDGKTYTVQYFQRAVFELHPDDPANQIVLRPLGKARYEEKYGK
jgi:hypothetical protein